MPVDIRSFFSKGKGEKKEGSQKIKNFRQSVKYAGDDEDQTKRDTVSPAKHFNESNQPTSASKRSPAATQRTKREPTSPEPTTPSPRKKSKTAAETSAKSPSPRQTVKTPKSLPKPPPRDPPLEPQLERDSFNVDTVAPECLAGYTFVFTGELENLNRSDATEMVKVCGGRVTTAVSNKTDYLVCGPVLEDDRDYKQGTKYKNALEKGTLIVVGERAFYGLLQQYDNKAKGVMDDTAADTAATAQRLERDTKPIPDKNETMSSSQVTNQNVNIAAAVKPVPPSAPVNPYAKGPLANPYSKTSVNPYAKPAANPYAKTTSQSTEDAKADYSVKDDANVLWVDKYKPTSTREILGNQESVRKLAQWLEQWEVRFNNPQATGKSFSAPNGPWKAALLSGPPGIGKTTTAMLVAKESGRDVIEFNASDVRSKKALHDDLGDIAGSQTISFSKTGKPAPYKKRCIIMDEVDGMGAGDRSGMSELIQMIKKSRVPIICICNDRQAQKIKSLVPYCMDLRFRRPVKSMIANRAIAVAAKEGLTVERNAAEAIAESCGNDVRQVLNCLHMWASDKRNRNNMTYKNLKDRENEINKDEMLRVGLFDAVRLILEGRRGLANANPEAERESFFRRNDAFFVDYAISGLLVQQNYLKVLQGQFNEAKRDNKDDGVVHVLENMHAAALSMSDFALAENQLRGDQNWGLLPFIGAMTVKTGYHAGGERGGSLPGYPEFTSWLGRNSTKGKKVRIMNDLQHHMNFHISGGTQQMRLSYLPVLRERFLSLLSDPSNDGTQQAIDLMDEYGLDRDDLFDKLDEFSMDAKADAFSKLDSKTKAAFTRLYNQGVHKSQALVAEQGGAGAKKTKRATSSVEETADPDAINDDVVVEEEDEAEDEEDLDKLKDLFKKKGKGGGKAKGRKKK